MREGFIQPGFSLFTSNSHWPIRWPVCLLMQITFCLPPMHFCGHVDSSEKSSGLTSHVLEESMHLSARTQLAAMSASGGHCKLGEISKKGIKNNAWQEFVRGRQRYTYSASTTLKPYPYTQNRAAESLTAESHWIGCRTAPPCPGTLCCSGSSPCTPDTHWREHTGPRWGARARHPAEHYVLQWGKERGTSKSLLDIQPARWRPILHLLI